MRNPNIFYNLVINLKNIPGWHTSRKIVVIECDDWGGIRIPSKEIYDKLIKEGIAITKSNFRYDTLESEEDLEPLFHVLDSVKDITGHSAIMSPITNMANPDFEKIRQSGFREYHYERFTDTLIRYGRGTGVLKLWKQGMRAGIFVPEFHGREHISVQFWLRKLQERNEDVMIAFDHGVVSVQVPGVHRTVKEFRPEFYFDAEEQKPFLTNSIIEGAALFDEVFGSNPRVFVPSDGIFHPDLEATVSKTGIKFLNVNHSSIIPDGIGGTKRKYYRDGQTGKGNLTYYIRNCAFEPYSDNYKGIELTLKQIAAAFRWGKPANISTHRVNFSGGISPENRERGIKELSKLLKAIVHKWPDVEFMSSGDALELMKNTNR